MRRAFCCGQRPKGLKDLSDLVLSSTCTQGRRADAAPVAVEPVAAPVPPAVVPIEATNVEVAVRVAVDRSPEEGIPSVATPHPSSINRG